MLHSLINSFAVFWLILSAKRTNSLICYYCPDRVKCNDPVYIQDLSPVTCPIKKDRCVVTVEWYPNNKIVTERLCISSKEKYCDKRRLANTKSNIRLVKCITCHNDYCNIASVLNKPKDFLLLISAVSVILLYE